VGRFHLALAWLIAMSLVIPAAAQTESAKSSGSSDKARIEALYQGYLKAFRAKDASAVMAVRSR
jgi:hypothetical protein